MIKNRLTNDRWDGKVTWHEPCPWPNERITIVHSRYVRPRCFSNKRACYGSEHVYMTGISEPNYPIPVKVVNHG